MRNPVTTAPAPKMKVKNNAMADPIWKTEYQSPSPMERILSVTLAILNVLSLMAAIVRPILGVSSAG
jgi:hypothetical protein